MMQSGKQVHAHLSLIPFSTYSFQTFPAVPTSVQGYLCACVPHTSGYHTLYKSPEEPAKIHKVGDPVRCPSPNNTWLKIVNQKVSASDPAAVRGHY